MIRTGIYRYSHFDDCWMERVDIDTKRGRQVLKWAPIDAERVPQEQREVIAAARAESVRSVAFAESLLRLMEGRR